MAIGAITMILTNVGLQMFNSWRGSKQSAELQQKREEFDQAARERNVAHMMKLMREGQELTLQIEKENHENRLNDIKGELDNLLQRLAYEMAITNWPLRVLPVVMKNQAFGNLLANQEEKLALHVILTRSNYDKFNNAVLPTIEKSLEQYCNQHWSTMGDHPVLFYSGAWKSKTAPTDVEVSAMKTSLNNLPTLLITPLFRPSDGQLVFQVNMWGVGAASTEEFAMTELEPTNFQRTFSNTDDYDKDGEICYEILEDIVPYLQCLIGYLADTYFWSSTGAAPLLPTLLTNGVINTDGIGYLKADYQQSYERLLQSSEDETSENPFTQSNSLALVDGCSVMWNETVKKQHLEDVFIGHVQKISPEHISSMKEALSSDCFSKNDLPFVKGFMQTYKYEDYKKELYELYELLQLVDFDYSILESTDIAYLEDLANKGNGAAMYRLGEIFEYSIGTKWNQGKAEEHYKKSASKGFVLGILKSDISRYDDYSLVVDSLIANGVEQAILIKAGSLCSQNKKAEALELLSNIESSHPALLYKKACLFKDIGTHTEMLEEALTIAANSGYVLAQELLCQLYEKDDVLSQNSQKHAFYAEKAMLQGSPTATYKMALCYLRGIEVQQSTHAALELIDHSIKLGCREAEYFKLLINNL